MAGGTRVSPPQRLPYRLYLPHLVGLATLLLVIGMPPPAGGNPDAKRLYDDLLSNYNRLIRPVANNTDKITVKMGLKLSQLVDLVGGAY